MEDDAAAASEAHVADAAASSPPLPAPSVPSSLYTASELATLSLPQSAWRFESWLHSYPLNSQTVLDYFKHSDYYERNCNNEVIIMQNLNMEAIKQLEGIEYSVDPQSTDEFFLIRKCWRVNPSTTQLLALYLVIGCDHPNDPLMPPRGTVSPMPDLHTVLRTNLATAVHYLAEAFDGLAQHATHHAAVAGYQWQFPQNPAASGSTEEEKGAESSAPAAAAAAPTIAIDSIEQQRRNPFSNLIDQAIMNLSKTVAMQTQQQGAGGTQR